MQQPILHNYTQRSCHFCKKSKLITWLIRVARGALLFALSRFLLLRIPHMGSEHCAVLVNGTPNNHISRSNGSNGN